MWIKKNPVLALTSLVTLYGVAVAQLKAQALVGDRLLEWLIFGGALLTAALGLATHNVVTSLAAPRDAAGNALVPAPPISVPPIAVPPAAPVVVMPPAPDTPPTP